MDSPALPGYADAGTEACHLSRSSRSAAEMLANGSPRLPGHNGPLVEVKAVVACGLEQQRAAGDEHAWVGEPAEEEMNLSAAHPVAEGGLRVLRAETAQRQLGRFEGHVALMLRGVSLSFLADLAPDVGVQLRPGLADHRRGDPVGALHGLRQG